MRALDAPCEYIPRTALGRGLQSASKFPRGAYRSDPHGTSGHIATKQGVSHLPELGLVAEGSGGIAGGGGLPFGQFVRFQIW